MLLDDPNASRQTTVGRLKHELPWVATILGGAITPLLIIISTGHTLAWRDTSRLYAPMRSLVAEALRNFQLPLWNPHEALGFPLFAQLMYGVLHPWSLIAAAVSRDGTDLLIILHVATGAVGAGLLARVLGTSRSSAVVAGLGYGLSGYLLSMSSNLTFLAGAGTAPWAIAGLRHAASAGLMGIVPGALGIAVLHFAGDPQWTLVAALFGMLLAWSHGHWQGLGKAAAAVAAGTALAGIQLVPAWELLTHSTRSEGLSPEDRTQWAFLPGRLVEFFIPGFTGGRIGPSSSPVFHWLGGGSRFSLPFVPSVFIGLPVLALALTGLKTGRSARMIGIATVFFLWLALGHQAGADRILGWIPVWGQFRYAEKLIGPFTLGIALLAAFGLEPFVNQVNVRSRFFAIAAGSALLLTALAVVLFKYPPLLTAIPEEVRNPMGDRLVLGLLLSALSFAAFAVGGHLYRRRPQAVPFDTTNLVLATVLLTGLCGSFTALHAGAPHSRATLPLPGLPALEPVPRIFTPIVAVGCPLEACQNLDSLDGEQAIHSRTGIPSYAIPTRIDNFDTYTGLVPKRWNELMIALAPLGEDKFITYRKRLALTHVVLPPNIPSSREHVALAATRGGRLLGIDPRWGVAVFGLDHRPWASFADRVVSVADEAKARATVAYLEYIGDPAVVLLGEPPSTLSRGHIVSIERSPTTVRIVAEAPRNGLLVVADAYWEGWRARIDGQPADLLLADGLLRAVHWPAGRHTLEMVYDPVEVRIGGVVSAGSALLLAGMAVGLSMRKRIARGNS